MISSVQTEEKSLICELQQLCDSSCKAGAMFSVYITTNEAGSDDVRKV